MQALFSQQVKNILLLVFAFLNFGEHMDNRIVRKERMRARLKREIVEVYLLRRNLSQNWLARRLDISSGYISQLLTGRRSPSPRLRARIMEYFKDHDFDDLFEIQR